MQNATPSGIEQCNVLRWLPEEVHLYLNHTEKGASIRSLARDRGVHASTVLRQVRKTEARREDPLVDALLTRLGEGVRDGQAAAQDGQVAGPAMDDDPVSPHVVRLLQALMKDRAVAIISQGVDTAVVLATKSDGDPVTLAKGPLEIVELMALRGWVEGQTQGRICRYHLTTDGRLALGKMIAQQESRATGFCATQTTFTGDPISQGNHPKRPPHTSAKRPVGADSPVRVLGRSKGRQQAYLEPELVAAAERLHRDFVLGQFELSGMTTWDKVQSAIKSSLPEANPSDRKLDARKRFSDAVAALGPELGQIALAVCCHEKGMERIEADMSMPARSGKYMLRVALNYLVRHYGRITTEDHNLVY